MARQYTAENYLQKVKMIKDRLDDPAITTDIIVGFPGETDTDFEDTLALCKAVGFSRIHVFSFSVRNGTAAEKMTPKTNPRIIKQRSQILQKLANELAYKYRNQIIGRTEHVLIESVENGTGTGRAERYFQVKIQNIPPILSRGDIAEVILIENTPTHLIAKLRR
jgi:threonylcarbamoyladenosine tRNA methylthiotransferase MtaB